MYYVYIIRSKQSKKFYTGMTNDMDRRIKEHNQKLSNTRTTRQDIDYEIQFLTQVDDRQTARLIEQYLKSGSGREFRNSIL